MDRPDGPSKVFDRKLPLEIRWTSEPGPCGLPINEIRLPPGRRRTSVLSPLDPVLHQYPGRPGEPLHLSQNLRALIADIATRCPVFDHLDPRRILVGCNQTRNGSRPGVMARIAGLRQRGGRLVSTHHGRPYIVQRYWLDDTEILYVLIFYLPRFQDQTFDEKMVTLFHELYHISPDFDGDLRRCPETDRFHVGGKQKYDGLMAKLAREYLQTKPDPALYAFLRLNFAQLQQWHGQVIGYAIPLPKLIPLENGKQT
ncbi:MAG: putative metallopeptidase [Gemmatales bacterium]|nr:putative metallopeptidase [Gemmatales bacterium]MDW8388084.1 putative metallopeptidase [Gemmatales bacterium]